MHNKISLWFIFSENIDYILRNIDIMKGITDDIHIYFKSKTHDENLIDVLRKKNVKINHKNNQGIKYIFKKSKYEWCLIVDENLRLIEADMKRVYENVKFNNECIEKNKYILLKKA